MWASVRVCVFGNKNIYRTHWKPVDTAILPDNLGYICVQCVRVCECVCVRFFRAISCNFFLVINDVGCHGRFLFALLCSAAILAPFLSLSFSYFLLCRTLFLLSFSLSFCRSQSFEMWNDDGYDKTSVKNHFQKTVFIIRSRHFRIYMHIIYPSNAVDENFEMFPVHIYFVLIQCSRQLMIDCMLYVCRYRRCCYCCRYSKLVCLVEEKIVLL